MLTAPAPPGPAARAGPVDGRGRDGRRPGRRGRPRGRRAARPAAAGRRQPGPRGRRPCRRPDAGAAAPHGHRRCRDRRQAAPARRRPRRRRPARGVRRSAGAAPAPLGRAARRSGCPSSCCWPSCRSPRWARAPSSSRSALFLTTLTVLRSLLRLAGTPGPDGRRAFLTNAVVVGLSVAGAGGVVRYLQQRADVGALRDAVGLPTPVRLAPGDLAAADLGVPGMPAVLTPNEVFYRIDTALAVPQVDPSRLVARGPGPGRPALLADLRRPAGAAAGRGRHHDAVRQQRGRRRPGRHGPLPGRAAARRAGPRRGARRGRAGPVHAPSTGSPPASRSATPPTADRPWSRSP